MKRLIGWGQLAVLLGLGTGLLSVSCGGDISDGRLESESHFLALCSGTCSGGLSCVNGVCTESCLIEEPDTCGEIFESAICTNESGESGAVAVCDVPCEKTASCSELSEMHRCVDGYCRGPQVDEDGDFFATGGGVGPGGTDGGAEAEQVASEDEVDYVYVQPVDFSERERELACGLPDGLFNEEGSLSCRLVSAALPPGGSVTCDSPGMTSVSAELSAAVREAMAGVSCEDAEGDCADFQFCEYLQVPAEQLTVCQNDTGQGLALTPAGFCGIDPFQVDAEGIAVDSPMGPVVEEACGLGERALRLIGSIMFFNSSDPEFWLACFVEPS